MRPKFFFVTIIFVKDILEKFSLSYLRIRYKEVKNNYFTLIWVNYTNNMVNKLIDKIINYLSQRPGKG